MQSWINRTFSGNCFLVGNLALGVLAFSFPIYYLFYLARHERDAGTKIWLVTKKGSFMCFKSWFLFFYFLLVTTLYIIQTLSDPTTFLYISLCFLLISDREFFIFLAFLQSLIGDFLFFFCFLKHIHNITVNETSFLGDPSILSSEGKGKNSYPGSRFMVEGLGFWLKLAEVKTWHMSGYLLGKRFRDKVIPHIISMTHI